MNTPRIKPIIRWPGGKSRMLKSLLPMIPEHVCYCEPFAGGLAMLLAKPRSQVEIINDINGDLIALYLNVQRHLPEVLRQVQMAVSSRKLFNLFREQRGLTDIERAIRFLIRSRTCFGGKISSFGVAKTASGGVAFSRASVSNLIAAAHERLDRVVIENISYERCLALYDSPDTFFFVDPPYVDAPTGSYDAWTIEDVKQLRSRLGSLKARWVVTLNDSEATRGIFKGCQIQAVVTRNRLVNNRTNSQKTFGEIIVTP